MHCPLSLGCTDASNKLASLLHAIRLEVDEADLDWYRKSVVCIVSDQGDGFLIG